MYIVFEDNSQFKAAKVLSEADNSLQIETSTGKRSKIKRNNVIFQFDQGPIENLISQARSLAEELDLQFLWECAPQEEFAVADFATDYFGATVSITEKTALLLRLHCAPAYFHRKGKGIYRPAPAEILHAALAALEKKRLQAQQQEDCVKQLKKFHLPEEIKPFVNSFLLKPDKNTLAWKAFSQAAEESGLSIEKFLLKLGVYPHALAIHWAKFLGTHFPRGTQAPTLDIPTLPDLPLSDVEAYSIDDESTTEIDDALAVKHLHDSVYQISVHIAAPALVVSRDSDLDAAARTRMSTVYTPGKKIPMQSDALIQTFSLDQGQPRPALSLYITANVETGEILDSQTKIEAITVKENLHSNKLDSLITKEDLEDEQADLPYAELFRPLWKMAQHLRKAREEVRGKPEQNSRIEYSFKLLGAYDDPDSIVQLIPRSRKAPLDLIVSEYMILTNQTWAGLLKEAGLPGIFRSQQGGRVRQSTYPAIHEAIGVQQYGWMTSPLRRYVDLLNQQQVLCVVKHGISARLVAPYKPKDADLFVILTQFESIYTQWRSFQDKIERYWSLRWLQQQNITQMAATVLRDDLIRLHELPMIIQINDMPPLARGEAVLVELHDIDLLTLTIRCSYKQHLQKQSADDGSEANDDFDGIDDVAVIDDLAAPNDNASVASVTTTVTAANSLTSGDISNEPT